MKVCLTFDAEFPDQPHNVSPQYGLATILSTLENHSTSAMFFIQGKWARAHPNLALSIAEQEHQIGSHTNSHVVAAHLTDAGFATDVAAAQATIRDVTGVDPRPWLRFPYGLTMHSRTLRALGYNEGVGWNIDSRDYRPETTPKEFVANVCSMPVGSNSTYVVLMHTWPEHTAKHLDEAISRLKDAGAEFGVLG